MCPPKPPKVQAPAAAPAPAAQGADQIQLGGDSTLDAEQLARQGIIGRSALRIGRGAAVGAAGGTTAGAASGVASLPAALGIGPAAAGPGSSGPSSSGSSSSAAGAGIGAGGDAGLRIGRGIVGNE